MTSVAGLPPASAEPVISGGDRLAYTEGSAEPLPIGAELTVTGGVTYGGEYVEYATGTPQASEALWLQSVDTADTTDGAVSVVGSSVYLGNGTTADIVGSIDETNDGRDGRPLRVNFTSSFTNSSFEAGVTGWTALEQRIDLGSTHIAGYQTVDDSTYPGGSGGNDDAPPTTSGSYTVAPSTVTASDGDRSLLLESSGMTTLNDCDVVHGPAVYSDEFEAAEDDRIYFDWRAFAGDDAYHVFGYILDETGTPTTVLDAYTDDENGESPWATTQTAIPASGTYRFVFVAGTYDASCGKAAGASLHIDNVRVFGTKASDEVVTQMSRLLMYENTGNNPPATVELQVTAKSADNGETTTTPVTVDVTLVDDAPAIDPIDSVQYTNTRAVDAPAPVTGSLSATDPEGDDITLGLEGAVAGETTVGGDVYTHSVVGDYGTLHVDLTTGDYAFEPDAAVVNARLVPGSDSFTFSATARDLSHERTITVAVDVPASVPDPVTDLVARPGDRAVTLTWTAPAWPGGSHVDDHVVEVSDDGGATWTVFDDGVDDSTSAVVRGLDNGTEYRFRVAAVNHTGTSATTDGTVAGVPRRPITLPAEPEPEPVPHRRPLATPPTEALERTPTGSLHRIYLTLFDRAGEEGGLQYWNARHDQGMSMRDIVVGFLRSSEWRDHHGDPHGPDLVQKLYLTVLGREPDAVGLGYWVALLESGRATEAQVVMAFVESSEMDARIREALALG